jgi:hypothetical protein
VAEEGKPKKKRGPKGGIKHRPGRGHRRKSEPDQKKRFRRRAEKKRIARDESIRQEWSEWDAMPPEEQKLRPEKKPKRQRPKDEDETTA